MKDELITVVDERDNAIENLPRHQVHTERLRHRAVHILVFNNKQQVFLQKRALTKDVNAGLWDTSAAGHVDADESYRASAIRETQEELGINIETSLTFLFKLPAQEKTSMEFIEVYRCLHNDDFILEENEIDDGQWFDISNISQRVLNNDLILTDTFKLLWATFEKTKLR